MHVRFSSSNVVLFVLLKKRKNLALQSEILLESVNPPIITVLLNQATNLSGNLSRITIEETINNINMEKQ